MRRKFKDIKNSDGHIVIQCELCDFCGSCVAVCPVDCIILGENDIDVDYIICNLCLNCVKVCPMHVIDLIEEGI